MKNRDIKISPSIIATDLSRTGEIVKNFDPAVVDLLHMDVMDGHFVPNITFGPAYIEQLQKNTDIPLDIHLMIEKPENTIDQYIAINPWCITIHYESTRFPARLLSLIRESGTRSGLSINPATPVEAIRDILPYADMVLIMSVDPGFYGQKFMPEATERIKNLSRYAAEQNLENFLIQVDGGINKENIGEVVAAGADILVAGGAAFKGEDVNSNVSSLKEAALG